MNYYSREKILLAGKNYYSGESIYYSRERYITRGREILAVYGTRGLPYGPNVLTDALFCIEPAVTIAILLA